MFKKSFAALAVFGFCASYANASSVILYGVVDEALVFMRILKTREQQFSCT